MHVLPASPTPGRRSVTARPWLVKSALAAGLLSGGLGLSAQAAIATPSPQVKVKHGTLSVKGTPKSDRLALRLKAGAPQTLQIDVDDNGSADFQVDRSRFDEIRVDAKQGDDVVRIDDINGAFTTTTPTRVYGRQGDDTLLGGAGGESLSGGRGDDTVRAGAGNDALSGGDGNDTVDGDQGVDTAFLGSGDDRFIWDPGDGSDVVEGQAGSDAMTFNGANVAEQFDVSANGGRVRFLRNVGSITMDLDGIEAIDVNALGGADQLTVNDVSGTDLKSVRSDLAGSGGTDDGSPDQVIVSGTTGDDVITAAGGAGSASVTGLAARVDVVHAQAPQDGLTIYALAGDDVVGASGLAADAIALRADGAEGDDLLVGGAGADTLLGGAGDDVLQGGPGLDVLDGGTGNNVVIQD